MKTLLPGRFVVGLLLLGLCAGCGSGDGRVRVHGKVTYQNEPVGNRTLTFCSEGAPGEFFTHSIHVEADGSFSGEVSARGTYRVVIEESRADQENRHPADPERKTIPLKYRSRDTSDKTVSLDKNDNYLEIALTD